MANWNLPTVNSNYLSFVDEINSKFVDVAQLYGFVNPPVGAVRFNRILGAQYGVEEWTTGGWTPKVFAINSGGTGAIDAPNARYNLGIGSMGVQNSNAVNITGGSITGVAYSANDITTGILSLARGGTGSALGGTTFGDVLLWNGAQIVLVSGLNIRGLDATYLLQGTVPDARLPNVGFINGVNNWGSTNNFNVGIITINGGYPGFYLVNNTGAVNHHKLFFFNYLGGLVIQAQNDDGSFGMNQLQIDQTTGSITGNGAGLYNLEASYIATGLINVARMGTGIANSTTFLRGDGTWQVVSTGGGGTTTPIPSGLIAMFNGNCPAGWTRFVQMDSRLPIGSPSAGQTGGATNHSHSVGLNTSSNGGHGHSFNSSVTIDGTTDANTQKVTLQYGTGSAIDVAYIGHNHHLRISGDFSGNTSNVADHSHQLNGQTAEVNMWPPYYTLVYCQKD